ncbi:BREX-2 system adenine-specific DNA-methyltransferase PglX [Streptomyces qinglanensis]|uniref:BREX-2 system adenine-specific DNA-methyltransferase PglX n=1 Tax=Streptomyces qinglanensis TaxID=943816 RepID=UPI0037BC8AF0
MTFEEARAEAGASMDREKHEALLKDLQKQVALLVTDLRERAALEEFDQPLRAEYDHAVEQERTAPQHYESWLEERLVQIAAAWVLGCVFVRFSEDNGLLPDAWLSGPGARLAEAQDRHDDHFRQHPEHNDRDWLFASFQALADAHSTAAALFDERHNPMREVTPSYGAASRLLAFWRERGPDGEIRYDFTDPELNTRFLGDLYQDLSEHARKTYALLQTPVFVEEFILDLTLEPAVEEFGLDPVWKHRPPRWRGETDQDGDVRGLRCIDPACGSGHFLLGLFERLLAKWRELEPGTDAWLLIRRALESVHGADKNPYAVSIARFRLLVAALKEGGVRELRRAPGMPVRVAVADSLLHGRDAGRGAGQTLDDAAGGEVFTYRTEDVKQYVDEVDLLGRGSYHVVVGNPPYITVKDKQENENYRKAYWACSRQYALSVPFAQRIFELAVRASGSHRDGGFTGQITANSFMKREFGKVLIESFFHGGPYKDPGTKRTDNYSGVELTHIIDTSGAYIPGHGTPTVILIGRHQMARQAMPIRAVLGIRGEPSIPKEGEPGCVWRAITEQVGKPGSQSEWVSVEDAERARFASFSWSLSGGGAQSVLTLLEQSPIQLKEVVTGIGRTTHTGLDEAFYLPPSAAMTRNLVSGTVPVILGDEVRNYCIASATRTLFPYTTIAPDSERGRARDLTAGEEKFLWRNRTVLRERLDFGETPEQRGLSWSSHSMFFPKRYRKLLSIAYGEVSTHNHFALNRGGKVFKQTAPVINLPDQDTEDRHLEVLGLLNSSTACFWLKQVSHDKGIRGEGGGFTSDEWERFYQFSSTKLQQFPVSDRAPLSLSRELDRLAQELAQHEPSAIATASTPTRAALDAAKAAQERIRSRMVLLQEELDWTVYGAYGLLTPREVARTTLTGDPGQLNDADVPQLKFGQRAFEIVMKQKVDSGELDTAWFDRHGSTETAVAEVPEDWPDTYKEVVKARLDVIDSHRDIRLIERPEYKRRWSTEPWEKREAAALRNWLLNAAEREELWFEERGEYTAPRTLTVFQLADALRHDEDFQAVAALYAADHLGKSDASLATVLAAVIEPEHVPYLAALRYKEPGLRKRAQWEEVWEQQREEDRTGERLDIKIPPKYTGADFLKHSYWSNRGKLDVPKERFISYPGASSDGDPSLLLGWAGWNHRDQAEALVNLINDRSSVDGWSHEDPRFIPLLAGLREIMPWVHQWYDEYDPEWGDNPAQEFQAALNLACTERSLSDSDLRDWRPEKKRRGRGAAG